MYHVLNTVMKSKDDTWRQQDSFARDALGEILCDGYWSDHRNIGPADIAHARFMKPFCRQFRTTARSAANVDANKHLVFLVSANAIFPDTCSPILDAIYTLGRR